MASNKYFAALDSLTPLFAELNRVTTEFAIWQAYPSEGNRCGQGCCGYTSEEVLTSREHYANAIDDTKNKILDILKSL